MFSEFVRVFLAYLQICFQIFTCAKILFCRLLEIWIAIKVVQTDGSIVGHVHEPVARRLAPLIRGGEVSHASAEVIGTSRPAPVGTWTQGGGIEIPCKYILKGNKAYKKNVRNAFAKK